MQETRDKTPERLEKHQSVNLVSEPSPKQVHPATTKSSSPSMKFLESPFDNLEDQKQPPTAVEQLQDQLLE